MDSNNDKVADGGETEELSCLVSAFQRVGLLVDQAWWTDQDHSDDYKLLSLELWNKVIHSNEMLANLGSREKAVSHKNSAKKRPHHVINHEKLPMGGYQLLKKDKLVLPTCRMEAAQAQKALALMDPTVPAPLAQSAFTDTKCVLAASWPLALLKTYPAISDTLKDPASRSVYSQRHAVGGSQKAENTVPYSIGSVSEFLLHKKISSPAVKNIWAKDSEKIWFNQSKEVKGGTWGPGLNANVPEFYPSVLLPPRQCPPRYSNVFDANYQSEVFPYNEDQTTGRIEQDNLVQEKLAQRGSSDQRLSHHLQGIASSSHSNVQRSYPEENSVPKLKQNEIKADLTFWLENVYPQRVIDLNKLETIARHFDLVCRHLAHPLPPIIKSISEVPSSTFPQNSERRLYRDVLARKADDILGKSKEEPDQNPFDELERQALEQYQSSETCLAPDPVDSKFQDLERQALEQYTEDCEDQFDGPANLSLAQPSTSRGFFSPEDVPNEHKIFQRTNDGSDTYVLESIVGSSFNKMSLHPESDVMGETDQFPPGFSHFKTKQSKKQAKKKKRQMAEDQKFTCSPQEKLRSASSSSYQLLHPVSSEEEVRRLATNLKSKVLNYLRGVDLRIAEDNRKANPKNKDSTDNPIQRRVRVSDITDLETFKTYIREISSKTRVTLLHHFKRIRSEIMESSSRGIISFVCPTTSEKRNIKKIIKKCLQLKNHAETMADVPRNLLNGVKREVLDTLELVHHTMEVIYTLSHMSKEASEDVGFLKIGKGLVTELYLGKTTLEDKSPYIKQRVLVEDRSVLLVVLFPRVPGLLYDRQYESLTSSRGWVIYMDHDDLIYEHELSLRFPKSKMETKDMWSSESWTHVLQVGVETCPAWVTFSSTCRQAEHFFWATLRLYKLVKTYERKNRGQPNSRVHSRREPTEVSRTQWTNAASRKKTPHR